MRLITSTDGYSIEIEPELYTIAEFANLIESRKKNKELILKELSYIYFYTDMASDFQFQSNELERHKDVKKYVGLPDTWKKDKLVEEAIEAYKYLSQTASSRLLQSVYIAVDKIKSQLETIDLNERDKVGKPIWNIKQIQDTIKAMPDLMMNIEKAEKQFIRSQEEVNNKKKSNKGLYDGVDLSKINS
jgi:hypothetical protein